MSELLDRAADAFARGVAGRPKVDGHAMTEATQALAAHRDRLREAVRASPQDETVRGQLRTANLAITLVMSGHFALGETPWEQLEAVPGLIDDLRRRAAPEPA